MKKIITIPIIILMIATATLPVIGGSIPDSLTDNENVYEISVSNFPKNNPNNYFFDYYFFWFFNSRKKLAIFFY